VDVINKSLGGGDVQAVHDAVNAADERGVVVVAAAGNDSGGPVIYPAAYTIVIAVSATNNDDDLASFSSVGSEVEIAAPGRNIYSTYKDGAYATMSGTSMASPHVAGVASLVIASGIADGNGNGRINDEVRARLRITADDLGTVGKDDLFGYGLVDAENAVLGTTGGNNLGGVNTSPSVTIDAPGDGSTFDSGSSVSFTESASDSEDGELTSTISWTSSIDGSIGTGANVLKILGDGAYTITASVTDGGGKTGSDSISITVGDAPVNSIFASVEMELSGEKGRDLIIPVFVTDANGAVAGASVSISLYLNDDLHATGGTSSTGSDGQIRWRLRNAPSGTWFVSVDSVESGSLSCTYCADDELEKP
jgi:subtilisin